MALHFARRSGHAEPFGQAETEALEQDRLGAIGRTTQRNRNSRPGGAAVGRVTSALAMAASSWRRLRGLLPRPARLRHCSSVFHNPDAAGVEQSAVEPCPNRKPGRAPDGELYCCRRASMIACLQPCDTSRKCCFMHDLRRPPPGCTWLQNCAKSGWQAAGNARASGTCAGGALQAAVLRALGRLRSGDCAFAPELASVRMTATAKLVLSCLHPSCGRRCIPAREANREPRPGDECSKREFATNEGIVRMTGMASGWMTFHSVRLRGQEAEQVVCRRPFLDLAHRGPARPQAREERKRPALSS